jgi:hypothetical protein
MICPVELAHEVFAWRAAGVGQDGGHDLLYGGCHGAGHESNRSDFASDCQEDHLVAGSGNHWHQRPADGAPVAALRVPPR